MKPYRPAHADAGPIQDSEVAEFAIQYLAATLALVPRPAFRWRR